MAIYKVSSGKATRLPQKQFTSESELQKFVESNLGEIMSTTFLASEYPIPNGRLDTLGIDEDDIPVIIEYKWKKDLSAIIQGLFYLDWIVQNKKPFESIVKDKLGPKAIVNWSVQPRLVIIAQGFDIKELSAVNHIAPTVELKKYSLHGDLFNIEDVNVNKIKKQPKINGAKEATNQHDLKSVVSKSDANIQEIFWALRESVLQLSDDVWEKVGGWYCDYRTVSTFASINLQKKKLKVYIKMGDTKFKDPGNMAQVVPKSYGFGNLNRVVDITEMDQVEAMLKLIQQAHEFVTG